MDDVQLLRDFKRLKLFILSQVETQGQFQCVTFYNYEEDKLKMVAQISNIDDIRAREELLNCDYIKIMYQKFKGNISFINVDLKNKTLNESNLNGMVSLKEKRSENVTPTQTVEEAMSDPNCTYYRFEGGAIGKYDPTTLLYYSLEPDNTWKVNFRVYDRIIDAQYDYEEIPSKKQPTGGLNK